MSHGWTNGAPFYQQYHEYSASDQRWRHVPSRQPSAAQPLQSFTVLSWNIDFRIPLGPERMRSALGHLETEVAALQHPSIIFLQEMTQPDLDIIQAQPWIQADYYVTDVNDERWESDQYGTCTLIPRHLPIKSVFRVHYPDTQFERDALFVDIESGRAGCLRLCNTHLESLVAQPPLRPSQLKCAANFMRTPDVLASVLGGDLNAIEPFDRTLHTENRLQDAYLVSGGEEDRQDGFTWGQMARRTERERFGLSRMDKLLFCGNLQLEKFERFGYGVEIDDQSQAGPLLEAGLERPWVTDHMGVKGTFRLLDRHLM